MKNTTWLLDILLLTLIGVLTYALFLGCHPYTVPDGGRYIEIPREMLKRHDFITPYLNGIKYFEKPPLFYWLQSLMLHSFGVNEWATRIVTASMAIFGALGCYFTTRHLYNRKTAWLSTLILMTCLLYFAMGHLVTLDMTLTTCLTLSLLCFLVGIKKQSRAWCYGFYIFAALAVLTKGLIGFVFPAMIIGFWVLLLNQWRILTKIFLPTGLLLFLAITLPWHLLVQHHNPEFFHYYFITQQFSRYATDVSGRYQPNWFFVPILLLGLFPWVVFLPQALFYHLPRKLKLWKHAPTEAFLLIWTVSIFLFYSFSHSKLVPYILPVVPPLAIFIGHYLADATQRHLPTWGINIGFSLLLPIALTFAYFFPQIPSLSPMVDGNAAMPFLLFASVSITLTSLLVFLPFSARLWRSIPSRVGILSLGTILLYLSLMAGMKYLDNRSIKPLATVITQQAGPNAEIMTYNEYYQDLAPYVKRRITIVNWKNELAFGLSHQPEAKAWMINTETMLDRWKSPRKIFMIARLDRYQDLVKRYPSLDWHVLAKTRLNVLLTNKGTTP